jgi:CubicO group peptidase (beta-lactamase class C family)
MQHSPGSNTIAVFQGNDLLWCKGFGWANIEQQIPADVESVYRIASLTKPFTSAALMVLVDQGVLALDDPVERVLPEIRNVIGYADYAPITFRQLASHMSGLAQEAELPNNVNGPIEQWEQKTLECIPTTRFEYPPGETFLYSNIAFCYLGLAIQRASGKPYMELIHHLILDPLGMAQSGFVLTPSMKAHLAEGYAHRDDGSINAETPAKEHAGRGCKVPAGGLYTTPGDLTRFYAALTGTSPVALFSEKSRSEMLKVQALKDENERYSLGLHIAIEPDGSHLLSCGGNIAGYAVRSAFDPVSTLGLFIFRNSNQRPGEDFFVLGLDLLREMLSARENA